MDKFMTGPGRAGQRGCPVCACRRLMGHLHVLDWRARDVGYGNRLREGGEIYPGINDLPVIARPLRLKHAIKQKLRKRKRR